MLIDRYREQLVANGHDPSVGYVGSGSGGLFLADTDEQAIEQYRADLRGDRRRMLAKHGDTRPGKSPSFATIEEASTTVPRSWDPERVAEKIVDYYKAYNHDLQSVR